MKTSASWRWKLFATTVVWSLACERRDTQMNTIKTPLPRIPTPRHTTPLSCLISIISPLTLLKFTAHFIWRTGSSNIYIHRSKKIRTKISHKRGPHLHIYIFIVWKKSQKRNRKKKNRVKKDRAEGVPSTVYRHIFTKPLQIEVDSKTSFKSVLYNESYVRLYQNSYGSRIYP